MGLLNQSRTPASRQPVQGQELGGGYAAREEAYNAAKAGRGEMVDIYRGGSGTEERVYTGETFDESEARLAGAKRDVGAFDAAQRAGVAQAGQTTAESRLAADVATEDLSSRSTPEARITQTRIADTKRTGALAEAQANVDKLTREADLYAEYGDVLSEAQVRKATALAPAIVVAGVKAHTQEGGGFDSKGFNTWLSRQKGEEQPLPVPTPAAIVALKNDPEKKAQFIEKFGQKAYDATVPPVAKGKPADAAPKVAPKKAAPKKPLSQAQWNRRAKAARKYAQLKTSGPGFRSVGQRASEAFEKIQKEFGDDLTSDELDAIIKTMGFK